MTRKLTPFNMNNISQLEHASMCLNYLCSATDVVDFMEYTNNSEILAQININILMGIKR